MRREKSIGAVKQNFTGLFRIVFTKFLFLLLYLFAVLGSSVTAHAAEPNRGATVFIKHSFVFADFDGDHLPDLALINGGYNEFSGDCWIQFQLTTSGSKSIRLEAPAGGLELEARDVNGDHAVDLVVASVWARNPVAILLNDGHGGFFRAEPAAFPSLFSNNDKACGATRDELTQTEGAPPQPQCGVSNNTKWLSNVFPNAEPFRCATSSSSHGRFLVSCPSRAPPQTPQI